MSLTGAQLSGSEFDFRLPPQAGNLSETLLFRNTMSDRVVYVDLVAAYLINDATVASRYVYVVFRDKDNYLIGGSSSIGYAASLTTLTVFTKNLPQITNCATLGFTTPLPDIPLKYGDSLSVCVAAGVAGDSLTVRCRGRICKVRSNV